MRRWKKDLMVVSGKVEPIGKTGFFYPTFRPATFMEKVRYCLGLRHKGPVWREVKP